MTDPSIEIPDWFGTLPARHVADLLPMSPGLRSALASFSPTTSFKDVCEVLQVRLETRVGVKGWDEDDLAAAVARLIAMKDTPVSEFLDGEVQVRVAAILARSAAHDRDTEKGAFKTFQAMVQAPLLTAVAEWRMRPSAVSSHILAVLGLLERLVEGQRVTPLDEIALFFHGLSARDRNFVVRYLELDGRPGDTLEVLGARAGITRERVRQIVQRFIDRSSRQRPPLPICAVAVAALKTTAMPATLEHWNQELPELLRLPSARDLTALRTLEHWGWLPKNTWLRTDGFLLVVPGTEDEEIGRDFIRRVTPVLRNAMRIGAASVGQLSMALQRERVVVASLLRSSGRWERLDDEWFVLKESGQYLLPRIAAKLLNVLGPLTVDQLRNGLRRYRRNQYRQRLEVPPRQVLRAVFKAADMLITDGDVVSLAEGPVPVTLSGGEAALVDALTENCVLTLHEISRAVKARGLSDALAKSFLTFSPLIGRVAYGLYTLRGRRVTHAEIEKAKDRLVEQSAPSLLDQRFQIDGSVLVRYRLPVDRDLVTYYVHPGMIPEGAWSLVEAQGRRPIFVRPTYVTGLQQIGRRMRGAGAREIDVRFEVARREVMVGVPAQEE